MPRDTLLLRLFLVAGWLLVGQTYQSQTAWAGVSPENVIVVVNADSHASRTIANHYVHLRKIPSSNVIFLKDVRGEENGDDLNMDLEVFKIKILRPVFETINARGLAAQARVIAYSADFPTSVNVKRHTDRLTNESLKQYQNATASITGLTYLYQFVLGDSESYLGWQSNFFARGAFSRYFENPFSGDRRGEFAEAKTFLDEQKYAEAATVLEKLFQGSTTLFPLAIMAAEARAKTNQSDAAIALIQKAIQAGWNSRVYLEDSEVLSPLLEDARLKTLKERLQEYPAVTQSPTGFSGAVAWTPTGLPVRDPKAGVRYMMSCMLAVVHQRGSTIEQAIEVLARSSDCDRTFPKGSFWFTNTADVRTKTRFPFIGDALLWLNTLGHDAEIIHRSIPNKGGNVIGLMLGTQNMNAIPNQKWKFVPGAISENLTSLSAHFGLDANTKITVLLHAGAAMSCGPVAEPYSIHHKFPKPTMYGYYANGVSAIEAFYLSLSSPYQTLIVGDPMAQPFAKAPMDWVKLTRSALGEEKLHLNFSRGRVPLVKEQTKAVSIEFFLEGKLSRAVPVVANARLNLPSDFSGELETSVVLVGGNPTRPRISHPKSISIDGQHSVPIARLSPESKDAQGVELECEGADSVRLMHHQEVVGVVQGPKGTVFMDRESFGDGPLRMRPVASFGDKNVFGKSHVIEP